MDLAARTGRHGDNFGLVVGNSGMHFGDTGSGNKRAWSYPVDRLKNMIARGCSIGPRDTLKARYVHPAVCNAAFIGVAEPYPCVAVKVSFYLAAYKMAFLIDLIGKSLLIARIQRVALRGDGRAAAKSRRHD